MDLEDLFEFNLPFKEPGPLGQKIIRILFGVLLTALSSAGVWKDFHEGYSDTNWFFNASATLLFISLILFGLLNVVLGLKSKWPAWLIPISFVTLFVARILFGP